MLDLSSADLEEIATALADPNDYEYHWLISPDTGEIAFWTADTGIDGQTPGRPRRAGLALTQLRTAGQTWPGVNNVNPKPIAHIEAARAIEQLLRHPRRAGRTS